MSKVDLFSSGRIGLFETQNRIVMAPMTRSRASFDGVPPELAVEYYSQRATAGLIITERHCALGGGLRLCADPVDIFTRTDQGVAWCYERRACQGRAHFSAIDARGTHCAFG